MHWHRAITEPFVYRRCTSRLSFAAQGLHWLAFCGLALLLPSCVRQPALGEPSGKARFLAFKKLTRGTGEAEVRRLLGPPDEIRRVDSKHLLDGTMMYAPDGIKHETHRWAYGMQQPGTFARAGIVSFDASNNVICAELPFGKTGTIVDGVTKVASDVASLPSGLSSRVDDITLNEARGLRPRGWSARLSITNASNQSVSTEWDEEMLYQLVSIEVCDERNVPIFWEDAPGFNGLSPTKRTVTLRAHSARTVDVGFGPDYYFGPLPPGSYFVRVFFEWHDGAYLASTPTKFTVPAFPAASEYWDRFRTTVSIGGGGPHR